jgi:hypothetical protein
MEVCLRVRPLEKVTTKHTCRKPRGAVVTGKTRAHIVAKWVEIVGDLLAPYKRAQFTGFPYYDIIVAAWRQEWQDIWLAADRMATGTNEVIKDTATWEQAWSDMTADGTLLADLPDDPRGDVHVTATFVWGPGERSQFFIINTDTEDLALLAGIENTGAQHTPYEIDGVFYTGPRWRVDYETDLALSPQTVADINDLEHVFHPRLNYQVSQAAFRDQRFEGIG